MLTQRQLVNTSQVQLLTTRPLPTISRDNTSLLPLPRDLPVGEHSIKWLRDRQVSPRWFGFAALWARGLERDLPISRVFYQPRLTAKVVNPGQNPGERCHSLTLPVQDSAWAVGSEGEQAGRFCRSGQKRHVGWYYLRMWSPLFFT